MKKLTIAAATVALAALTAGCESQGGDPPAGGFEKIQVPIYDNPLTFCNHGNRVYYSDHGVAVAPADPSCAN